jgi:hypothetical protein
MPVAGVDLSPSSSAAVVLNDDGSVAEFEHFDLRDADVKKSMRPRFDMAHLVMEWVASAGGKDDVVWVGLEDYDLSGTQQVGYQIAETAGLFKYLLLYDHFGQKTDYWKLALIHPVKRTSYVRRHSDDPPKKIDKNAVIAWALAEGFEPPVKVRGGDGYDKRQREDLADAYVLARMTLELAAHLENGAAPQTGHLLLDPKNGVAFRQDHLFNVTALSTGAS